MSEKDLEKENIRAEFSEFISLKQKEKAQTLVSSVMSTGVESQGNILPKVENQHNSTAVSGAITVKKSTETVNGSDAKYLGVVASGSNIQKNISNEEDAAVKIQSMVRQKQSASNVDSLKAAKKDAIDSVVAEGDVHESLSILSSTKHVSDDKLETSNVNGVEKGIAAGTEHSTHGKPTLFDRDEVLRQLFDMFDKDQDRHLNKTEFFSAYKSLIESDAISDDELSSIFQHFDDNHNGLVSFQEFEIHFAETIDFDDAQLILEDQQVLKQTMEAEQNENGATHVWPALELSVENCTFNNNKLHSESVMEEDDLRVFTCTWNMHGKKAPAVDQLRKILPPNLCHLYVIGTQECERTAAQSVYNFSKLKFPKMVKECLGKDYFLVHGEALAAIQCIVFAHVSLKEHICNHKAEVVATGIGNTFGNKGGCGISLAVGKTSLLFVSAHFAAHQHKITERNEHFRMINENLNLHRPDFVPMVEIGTGNDVSDRFHHVFWLGDFNYRINGTREAVDKMLSLNMHESLIKNDQLNIERQKGKVFQGFNEGPLHFRPTYKFDKGTDVYDSSRKQRVPAWTDRILWRSNGGHDIQLLAYDCEQTVKTSDHRAVRAVFNIPKIVNKDPTGEIRKQRRNTKFGRHDSQVCVVM